MTTTKTPQASIMVLTSSIVAALSLSPVQAKDVDLTKLSLDELMHLDVIQTTVPGAHYHYAGDWMIGYEDQVTQWNGLQSGTSSVSNSQVFQQFAAAETSATENMQMIMLMYGIRDNWTVSATIPQVSMAMNTVFPQGVFPAGGTAQQTGQNFVAGLGDVSLSVIHPLKYHYPSQVELQLGVGFPTGDINEFGLVNGSFDPQKLPYMMQLGTGSFTVQPAVTYLYQTNKVAAGAQLRGVVPVNTNADGWIAPDTMTLTAWAAPHLENKWNLTPSFRFDFSTWGNIRGSDPLIDISGEPENNPADYAGSRADVFVGVNFALNQDGAGHGQWVTLEAGWPVYQNLSGPQLRLSNIYNGAIQWTFK